VSARLRIYLTGTVCLESGGMVVDERQLPARQGRLVLAYLVCERSRPVTWDERGDAIWSDTLPTAWESALSALVSMLRHLLQSLGLPTAAASISGRSGRYQIQLPSNTWVDIEAAAQALDCTAALSTWGLTLFNGTRAPLPAAVVSSVQRSRAE
jgi:SARP family transcriptional regulator, regulator of embCAB operon